MIDFTYLNFLNTFKESEITCPYCGWKDPDSSEMTEDKEIETECGKCEKRFCVEREIDITYTSSKKLN